MRDAVSVIQHAYSVLLYIQETTSCSGCCTVHGELKLKTFFFLQSGECNVCLPLYVEVGAQKTLNVMSLIAAKKKHEENLPIYFLCVYLLVVIRVKT